MARQGSGKFLLLLASLFDLSSGLGSAGDYGAFAVHVNSGHAAPTAINLHLVGSGVQVVDADAEDAIVLHHVLVHHHVESALESSIILLVVLLCAHEIAIDTHLTCTATSLQGRRLGHIHPGHRRVENGTLLSEVVLLLLIMC